MTEEVILQTPSSLALEDLGELREAVEQSWQKDTSSDPENWTEENPEWGQCVVTSLLIQELLDPSIPREIVSSKAKLDGNGREVMHYAVRLPDESVVLDWTHDQFPEDTLFTQYKPIEFKSSKIEEQLDSELAQKYTIFKNRVIQRLRKTT